MPAASIIDGGQRGSTRPTCSNVADLEAWMRDAGASRQVLETMAIGSRAPRSERTIGDRIDQVLKQDGTRHAAA